MLLFSQLKDITKGKIAELQTDLPIEILIIDSRKIVASTHALFFAIKGQRHDGHIYIEDAYKAGIRQFVVEKYGPKMGLYSEANFFVVENAITALQDIATYKRSKFQIPVLGITGSNAKTIVKEWLSQVLSNDFIIVKSPKSYNSQIGVPISVWQMNERHNFGIFEAGISKPGEMGLLKNIIEPNFGIFTNIGSAHDEGFTSLTQKVNEKLKLFTNVDTLFYCANEEIIDTQVKKQGINAFTWAIDKEADVVAHLIFSSDTKSIFHLKSKVKNIYSEFELEFPFADAASIENLMHCIAVMLYFNVSKSDIQARITSLKKVSMRLELKQGINNTYIIDDTYNNDLAGLTIALDFLKQQNQKSDKTIILSDLFETGLDEKALYQNIADILVEKGINKLIGIGSQISSHHSAFTKIDSQFYYSTRNFLHSFHSHHFANEVILIKGWRIFEFEKIVLQLQQKSHRTVLEINLDALVHNLNFYKSQLHPETKIMAMVKSFAYGSGSLETAQLLQFQRVDYLAVAYADEGVTLRENGIHLPIMVLNPTEESFESMTNFKLEPVIYSLSELRSLIAYLDENASTIKAHLEIETGMHRLGIAETELDTLLKLIVESQRISIVSVFSHLAGADSDEFIQYSREQYAKLLKASFHIENKLRYKVTKHLLNSAGIVRFPDFQLDMVRLGIGLYGVEANGNLQSNLMPVSALKTRISQIKKVKAGETIGYSRKGKALKDSTIAVIAIGYGDGYSRKLSNGVGKVWLDGKLAPVIGNICMDMSMIDISDIPNAKEGDQVEIFGTHISIMELAKSLETIPYEILTQVSERVKRVFYSE
ncbi:MAG: bifunctional UDP-N-acetylmuramoyl-tripeptide:D-alanyl-D-alanine ligase/alanine racemase [Cytophagales bacterium]